MSRKRGPDIRNGNWLFYNDQLMSTLMGTTRDTMNQLRVICPEELAEVVANSEDIILTALESLAEHAHATSPNPAKSVKPAWIFTAKMVPAGEKAARGTVLRERAFDRSTRQVGYSSSRDFLPGSRQYLERMQQIGYSARLLLNLGNWNEVRDGGWLQIQPLTSNI